MNYKNHYELYNIYKILRPVGMIRWVKNAIRIPATLLNAKLMSDVVSAALDRDIQKAINYSVSILLLVIIFKIISLLLSIVIAEKSKCETHKCKMILYKQLLMSPLHLQYAKSRGQILENLTNDFDTIVALYVTHYPDLFIGVATSLLYTVFIAKDSILLVASLLFISILQIIPPIVIRRYMQINYNDNREVEGEITDFTVAAHEGMATIKLYNLKTWYLNKLKSIHNKYLKIGKRAEFTMAGQNAMEALVNNIIKYGMYVIIGLFMLSEIITLNVGVEAIVIAEHLFAAVLSVFNCLPQFALVKKAEERLSPWFEKKNDYFTLSFNDSEIVKIKNLSYKYEEKYILKNVSFAVRYNETIIIKGGNGAGKSTLLNIICGLVEKQEGTITFGTKDNMDILRVKLGENIIYLPQDDIDYSFPPKQLFEMLDKFEISPSKLEKWGISVKTMEETNIASLSGGEKKKLYLALALELNPDLLILDEPSNSLDSHTIMILINKLKGREKATILVTHDDIFDSLTQKIYYLQNGVIEVECN